MYSSNRSQEPPNNGTPGPFDGPQWPHQAPRGMYLSVAVLMGIVVVSASVVNGLVIVVSIRYKKLRSPLNYILVNLAVADLLVTLCGSSVSFSNNINGFFMFGKRMCELEGFMVSLTGIVGLWSLAILAFERYVAVCRPLGDFRFQHRHAVSGCAFTWSWSLLWTTPPLLGWSSYVPEGLRTSCGPNWYTGGSNNSSYILALFVTCFVMPLSLILFSYTNLLMTLRAAAAQQQESDTTQQAEQEVTRMVITMVMAFLTCWLPYTTFALVVATNKDIAIQPALASLPSYFSKTATIYNPIIYVFMNKQFQSCLLKMVCCGYHPWGDEKNRSGRSRPPRRRRCRWAAEEGDTVSPRLTATRSCLHPGQLRAQPVLPSLVQHPHREGPGAGAAPTPGRWVALGEVPSSPHAAPQKDTTLSSFGRGATPSWDKLQTLISLS